MATTISTTFIQWRRTTSSIGVGSEYSDSYLRLGNGSGYTYTGYTKFTLPSQAGNITVKYIDSSSGSPGATYYGLLTQTENAYAKVALGLSVNLNDTTVTLTPSVTTRLSDGYDLTFSVNGSFSPGTYYFYTWSADNGSFLKFEKTNCSIEYATGNTGSSYDVNVSKVKYNNAWSRYSDVYCKYNSNWVLARDIYVNVNGVWRQII